MNASPSDIRLIQELQSVEYRFLTALTSGVDACAEFSNYLQHTLAQAEQFIASGHASRQLTEVFAGATRSASTICSSFMAIEDRHLAIQNARSETITEILGRAGFRRRRKRSTRSRKSKAGKCGRVRQSGKKSKRGRKSPVGNPKRRVNPGAASTSASTNDQTGLPGKSTAHDGKKSRTVTAPPTDSMKFGESPLATLLCISG